MSAPPESKNAMKKRLKAEVRIRNMMRHNEA